MPLPPGATIVAMVHTHPMMEADSVFGHCKKYEHGDSVQVKLFPGDDQHEQGYAGSDYGEGGGSFDDWSMAATYPTSSGIGIDVYVMN